MIGWIGFEAVQRFATPEPVKGEAVFIVAAIGLVVNMIVAWVLSQDKTQRQYQGSSGPRSR